MLAIQKGCGFPVLQAVKQSCIKMDSEKICCVVPVVISADILWVLLGTILLRALNFAFLSKPCSH